MKGTVIAERTLISIDNPKQKVIVKLGKPIFNHETKDYECTYEIVGAGLKRSRFVAGLDTFQALQLALSMIGSEIAQIELECGIHLRFSDLPDSGFHVHGTSNG